MPVIIPIDVVRSQSSITGNTNNVFDIIPSNSKHNKNVIVLLFLFSLASGTFIA